MRSPKTAVTLLRQQVRPATATDVAAIKAWLVDLGSDKFAVRQKAQAELEKMGELAAPQLEQVLENKPSLEVRQRVEALLQKLESQPAPAAYQWYLSDASTKSRREVPVDLSKPDGPERIDAWLGALERAARRLQRQARQ